MALLHAAPPKKGKIRKEVEADFLAVAQYLRPGTFRDLILSENKEHRVDGELFLSREERLLVKEASDRQTEGRGADDKVGEDDKTSHSTTDENSGDNTRTTASSGAQSPVDKS